MILIVDRSLKNAKTISEIFHFMGVLSRAVTPDQALNEISNRYRAVLFSSTNNLISPDELIANLRKFSLGAPIFALSPFKNAKDDEGNFIMSRFDGVFYENSFSTTVVNSIISYQLKNRLPIMGEYMLAGMDASVFNKEVTYFDEPISVGKTETMILRYLMRSYPIPAKASAILKYAFKPSRTPDISSIKTHICVMNKKYKEAFGKNLIFSEPGIGYTVLTPEMMQKKFKTKEVI